MIRYACPPLRVLPRLTGLLRAVMAAAALGAGLWGAGSTELRAQHSHYNLPAALPESEIAALEARRRALFAQWRARPADLSLAFAYANLSARLGDYEAAAATYEAMILREPRAARLRLDLGAIYFRLGADHLASAQFRHVRAEAGTPAPVRARIDDYLAQIERRRGGAAGWSGQVSFGLRWQDNANSATAAESVTLFDGLSYRLSADARGQADASLHLSAQLRHRARWGNDGHQWLTALGLSANEYGRLHSLSTRSAEVQTGPAFALSGPGLWSQARLALALRYGESRMGGEGFLRATALAASLQKSLSRRDLLTLSLESRREQYHAAPSRPKAYEQDGDRLRLAARLVHQWRPDWQLSAGLSREWRSAAVKSNAWRETGLTLGVMHRYAAPVAFAAGTPWSTGATLRLARRQNLAPQALFSTTTAQRGTDYGLELRHQMALPARLQLDLNAGWRGVRSNYALRSFTDRYVGLTLTRSF